jgi:hypothetical protein
MKRSTTAIVALTVLAALGTGCRSMTGRSLGTNIDDATTTANVKSRLTTRNLRHLTWTDVDTRSGVVYLTGNAASPAERQEAERVARQVAGVRDVVNNLRVPGEAAAAAVEPPATTPAPATETPASASPAGLAGPHRMLGEVASLDRDTGRIALRTVDGDLMLQLPPAAVQTLREGDRVTVEVSIARTR